MPTPQEILQQSTTAAQEAAKVAGLTFTPGATIQDNQIVKSPSVITADPARQKTIKNIQYLNQTSNQPVSLNPITATSQNPQIQSMIDSINKTAGNINEIAEPAQIKQGIANINNLIAEINKRNVEANNYNSINDYQKLNEEIQGIRSLQNQRDATISNLYGQLQPLREKYLTSLQPTQEETDLGTQLADITKKQADFELSLAQGQQEQFGLGRPLALSTGRALELGRQAQFTRQDLTNQANLLLNKLNLKVSQRELQKKGYETTLDFLQKDLDFQQKLQDRLDKEETDLLNRVDKLDTQQRQVFADMLDSLKGVDPDTLSDDVKLQLQQISTQRKIPFEVLMSGLKTSYNQANADILYKRAQAAKALQPGTDLTSTQKDYNLAVSQGYKGSFMEYQREIAGAKEAGKIEARAATTDAGTLKQDALSSAQSLLDKFDKGEGTSAVGKSRIFGLQFLPGSAPKNFEIQFNNLKSLLSLDNVKYLKGQGQISDAERELLANASSKLDLAQSEKEFKSSLENIIKSLNNPAPVSQPIQGQEIKLQGTTPSGLKYEIIP